MWIRKMIQGRRGTKVMEKKKVYLPSSQWCPLRHCSSFQLCRFQAQVSRIQRRSWIESAHRHCGGGSTGQARSKWSSELCDIQRWGCSVGRTGDIVLPAAKVSILSATMEPLENADVLHRHLQGRFHFHSFRAPWFQHA